MGWQMQHRQVELVNHVVNEVKIFLNQSQLKQGLGANLNALESLELYLSYEQLKKALEEVQQNNNENSESSTDDKLSPLVKFLEARWARIGTPNETVLAYHIDAAHPLNQCCLRLAQLIATAKKGYCFYSVNENVVDYEFKSVSSIPLELEIMKFYCIDQEHSITYQTSTMTEPGTLNKSEFEFVGAMDMGSFLFKKTKILSITNTRQHTASLPTEASLQKQFKERLQSPAVIKTGDLYFVYDLEAHQKIKLVDSDDLEENYMAVAPLKLLMPNIDTGQQFETNLCALLPHQIILSKHTPPLVIEVAACVRSAPVYMKFQYTSSTTDGKNVLKNEEVNVLKLHSKEADKAVTVIDNMVTFINSDNSVLTAIKRLIAGLRAGGVHGGHGGEEHKAGADANVAITDFSKYLAKLTSEEKDRLFSNSAEFRDAWERLSNPTQDRVQGVRLCVEVIAGNIEVAIRDEAKFTWEPVYYQASRERPKWESTPFKEQIEESQEQLHVALNQRVPTFNQERVNRRNSNNCLLQSYIGMTNENQIDELKQVVKQHGYLRFLLPLIRTGLDQMHFVLLYSFLEPSNELPLEQDVKQFLECLNKTQPQVQIQLINSQLMKYISLIDDHKKLIELLTNQFFIRGIEFSSEVKIAIINKVFANHQFRENYVDTVEALYYILTKANLNLNKTGALVDIFVRTLTFTDEYKNNKLNLTTLLRSLDFFDNNSKQRILLSLDDNVMIPAISKASLDDLNKIRELISTQNHVKKWCKVLEIKCLLIEIDNLLNDNFLNAADKKLAINLQNVLKDKTLQKQLEKDNAEIVIANGRLKQIYSQYKTLLHKTKYDFVVVNGTGNVYNYLFKIVILDWVGRSNPLVLQNVLPNRSTGEELCLMSFQNNTNSHIVKTQIVGYAGNDPVNRMRATPFRSVKCVISLVDLEKSIHEIESEIAIQMGEFESCLNAGVVIMFVGVNGERANQLLEKTELLERLASEHVASVYELSYCLVGPHTGVSFENIVQVAVQKVYDKKVPQAQVRQQTPAAAPQTNSFWSSVWPFNLTQGEQRAEEPSQGYSWFRQ